MPWVPYSLIYVFPRLLLNSEKSVFFIFENVVMMCTPTGLPPSYVGCFVIRMLSRRPLARAPRLARADWPVPESTLWLIGRAPTFATSHSGRGEWVSIRRESGLHSVGLFYPR